MPRRTCSTSSSVQTGSRNYQERFKAQPNDYAITAYDGALVVLDAVKRVAESGKEVNRSNVRDAMQATKLKTLQGEISFDENGDMQLQGGQRVPVSPRPQVSGRRRRPPAQVHRRRAARLVTAMLRGRIVSHYAIEVASPHQVTEVLR